MKINTEPARGTKYFGPKEMIMRDYVKQEILDTYRKNGFMHIKTPMLEDINLLGGSDSGENTKLMFKILKRGEKLRLDGEVKENDLADLGLRYDLTVPLARFYANNQNNLPKPFKSIQIDDAFRAERPQKGRYRQFTQCDIDVLGDDSPNAEIEILTVAGETLENLGFSDFVFKINDRRILNALIQISGFDESQNEKICIILDKRDKIGYEGVQRELLEKGYPAECVEKIIEKLKIVTENGINALYDMKIDNEIIDRLLYIIDTVNTVATKYKVEFDCSIIRGQGYYTSTVMEVYLNGFNGACGGGGRYDKMIGKIINVETSAVGFSIGYERVCLILSESERDFEQNNVSLIYDKRDDFKEVLKFGKGLKEQGLNVNIVPKAKNLTNQLNKLKENGFKKFVLYPDQNVKILN